MAKHLLSLDIPDTTNDCVLRIVDTSIMASGIPADCATLEITPPGFFQAYQYLSLSPGFMVNLTACDIELQTYACDTVKNTFSDGVYIIRYSVSPNDKVYVEYNHLRITTALKKFEALLCCLDIKGCAPTSDLSKELNEIQLLMTMLKAAKANVEYCHKPGNGMDIYNYVMTKLSKISCRNGCSKC